MSSGKLFFNPIDPFRKQQALLSYFFPEDDYDLELRPFWLAGDLIVLYEWLANPGTRQNAGLSNAQKSLFRYYRDLLQSDCSQPLTVCKGMAEVLQISLVPVQHEEWASHLNSRAFDCSIRYIFSKPQKTRNLFSNSLFMITYYFYTIGNTGCLYLKVPLADNTTNLSVLLAGFSRIDQFTLASELQNLYVYAPEQFEKSSFKP